MNYPKLRQITKLYFSLRDIARALKITPASARVSASRLVKSGLLVRAKKDTYLTREKWDSLSRKDIFILANLLQVPSYISFLSALSYYQVTTQVQQKFVESAAVYRTKEVQVRGELFTYTKLNPRLYFGFRKEKGFFIASPEKALLDALYLKSLRKYNFDLTAIDSDKLDFSELSRMAKAYPLKTRELLKNEPLRKTRSL
jgi:predicted transcriptional regulator of viral defense system